MRNWRDPMESKRIFINTLSCKHGRFGRAIACVIKKYYDTQSYSSFYKFKVRFPGCNIITCTHCFESGFKKQQNTDLIYWTGGRFTDKYIQLIQQPKIIYHQDYQEIYSAMFERLKLVCRYNLDFDQWWNQLKPKIYDILLETLINKNCSGLAVEYLL